MEKEMRKNRKGNSRPDFGIGNKNIVKSKRSQITLFIILAIVVIAVIVLLAYPRIKATYFTAKSPPDFFESCLSEDMQSVISKLEAQGGSLNPENTLLYEGNKVDYLCYTNQYYQTCTMQQPFLTQHFEQEIAAAIKNKTQDCVNALVKDYERKGYQAKANKPTIEVSLMPHNIRIDVNLGLTLSKETTESFDKISLTKKSEIYDLLMIAQSILNWEARYGDSIPESYMLYYPDLKVEKFKQGEGSKIYIITDKPTSEKFIFAARSLGLPPGYSMDTSVK